MKQIGVVVLVALVLLNAGTVYGLGGGGSRGDGRMDYRQPAAAVGEPVTSLSGDATQGLKGDQGNAVADSAQRSDTAGGAATRTYAQVVPNGDPASSGGATVSAVSVAEPASVFLIGCALIGFAGLRKKRTGIRNTKHDSKWSQH